MTLDELKKQVAAGAINPGLQGVTTHCTLCQRDLTPFSKRYACEAYREDTGWFRVCPFCFQQHEGSKGRSKMRPAGVPDSRHARKRKISSYKRLKADYSSAPARHELRAIAAKQHQKAPKPAQRRFAKSKPNGD